MDPSQTFIVKAGRPTARGWVSLFNGRNLDGWVASFKNLYIKRLMPALPGTAPHPTEPVVP